MYDNRMIGISYKISDDLSVSYNELESRKSSRGTDVDQDFDSISVSYSMGGMTINLADSDVSNSAYTSGRAVDATSVSLAIAF